MKKLGSFSFAGTRRRGLLRLAACLLCAWPVRAHAHDGPPYAILVDQRAGPCVVSVWADPDVGTGTFFIILEPPPDGAIPDDLNITLAAQPASGRLPETRYAAAREGLSRRVQYKAEVQFDAEEVWRVRVLLDSARGGGELSTEVEVTPPGLGRWDVPFYLFPFVAVGALWVRALLYRRKNRLPLNVAAAAPRRRRIRERFSPDS